MPRPVRAKKDPDSKAEFGRHGGSIAHSLSLLARAIHESLEVAKLHLTWLQSQMGGMSLNDLAEIRAALKALTIKQKIMAQTQAELAEQVRQLTAQAGTVGTDIDTILARLKVLEDAAANQPEATQELIDAVDGLKTVIQAADDKYVATPPTAKGR